jgi:topoisomerase-4 subunit B
VLNLCRKDFKKSSILLHQYQELRKSFIEPSIILSKYVRLKVMTNLFDDKKTRDTLSYSAEDIEVLEGLEPVRRRPGMYIGGTDARALHHLVTEVLDNSMDEAVAGHASKIWLQLDDNGCVTVRDNGRGIPIDPHPKFPDKSALEVILTTLHSGGKFSQKAYETAGGLHGVGISVVNALSDYLYVEVARDKQLWAQEYSRGLPQTPLKLAGNAPNRRGTSITFHPDPVIFGEKAHLDAATIFKLAQSKAYLYKGVEIHWSCPESLASSNTPSQAVLHFPNGLHDFINQEVGAMPLLVPIFTGDAKFPDLHGRAEWAVAWLAEDDGQGTISYCNTIVTPQGGTHEAGLRQAILKGLRTYGERLNNRRAAQIMADDCFVGTIAVVSVFIREPQFQGQTKEKLATAEVTKWVENAIKDHFDHWLAGNTQQATILLEAIATRADERLKRKQQKETARQSATRRLRLPGKLADCSNATAEGTELFLVEGDSAGGSAKQARNRATQAVLPLRGKILNVATATLDKLMANQELQDLTQALGCGSGTHFDLSRLRYEKVIIMTDADVDGAHIAALLMTFFFREMAPLVAAGRLYLARPPLYRLSSGSVSIYAQNDEEKEKLLKSKFKTTKVEISRFKGLGEMPAAQLRETTMDPNRRTLLQVTLPPPEAREDLQALTKFVDDLMGRKPENRFIFIQRNAQFAQVDL